MEARESIGRTVSSNQNIRAAENGRNRRQQLKLDRPVAELAFSRFRFSSRDARLILFHSGLIIFRRLALYKGYRARRTLRQAVAKTVTVIIADKPRFPVNNCDRAFMTCHGTFAAANALFFIYIYYLADHKYTSLHIYPNYI